MFKKFKSLKKSIGHWMDFSPPGALSTEGWISFREEFKRTAPIRYYINDTVYRKYFYPIRHKITDIKYWIKYRTSERNHIVNTKLPPEYYEANHIILYANFSILQDHVEVKLAHRYNVYNQTCPTSITRFIPFYNFFKTFRSVELGLKSLEYSSSLDDPSLPPSEQSPQEAIHARKVLRLYKWWTLERPARKFVEIPKYDDQGFDDIFGSLAAGFDVSKPDFVAFKKALAYNNKLENKWYKEDQKMLIELIKIRNELWT